MRKLDESISAVERNSTMHSGPRSYHLGSSQARTRAEDEFVNKMRNKLLLTQPTLNGGRRGGRGQ